MEKFDNLIICGRPAAGKSEFIDFMKKVDVKERVKRYHIGHFEEMDDFVWIWEKFMEDNMWQSAGYDRIYSNDFDGNYGLKKDKGALFDLMLTKFNHEIKRYVNNKAFYNDGTLFIEFARGGKDAYARTFPRLSKEIFTNTAVLFIKVSFEESWRKNVARYEEKLKHSILAHMVPRDTMETFYRDEDWNTFTKGKTDGFIEVHGLKVPFVTMENEPELKDDKALDKRYNEALGILWEKYKKCLSA